MKHQSIHWQAEAGKKRDRQGDRKRETTRQGDKELERQAGTESGRLTDRQEERVKETSKRERETCRPGERV